LRVVARRQVPCLAVQRAFEKAFGERSVHVVPRSKLGPEYAAMMQSAINIGTASEAEAAAFREGADCYASVKKPGTSQTFHVQADAFFKDERLVESDLPVELNEVEAESRDLFEKGVRELLAKEAPSCALEDIHEYEKIEEFNLEGPGWSPGQEGVYGHVHLTGCTVPDFIRVAEAYGY
jgi:hypothetical protein